MRPDYMAPWRWAQHELGEAEFPGAHSNRRIIWYHSFTKLNALADNIPWCSAFLCAAAEQSGYDSTKSAAAISWKNFGVEGSGEVGDIALFCFDGHYHVTLVNRRFVAAELVVECVGGNQADKVSVVPFKASGLVCFRRFP